MQDQPNRLDFMVNSLSAERLSKYFSTPETSLEEALDLYRCNIRMSMAYYGLIHIFEVTLRNRMASIFVNSFGDD